MFWHYLAAHFRIPKAELKRRMSFREYQEWRAYFRLEPFGEVREDLRNARLCYEVAAPWRKKGGPPARLTDYLLGYERPKLSPEDQERMMMQWVRTQPNVVWKERHGARRV